MQGREITVNALKYDGSLRRHWTAGVVSQTDELTIAVGRFEFDVNHSDLGLIEQGTVSFEHFWKDRWYNIFRFHEPDGSLRNYYCNVAMPFTFDGETLEFVDLDIDVVVWPDGRFEVLDRNDFEENSVKFDYPGDLIEKAESALIELLSLIDAGKLP
ncbi:MAG: DUF402 domain-containing protein [Pyrinomonadaceae bacterium]|nr:DUF402 domain-containing protein [Acidobacteriota bacterium]MBP7475695.1 DUF402 domain-containing protein [Pyrinomonadaceae bacterium]MBP9110131.1 DUF402 domain-containing protein [Pyrinomonadaceae bacterium]